MNWAQLRQAVLDRAGNRCEYCRLPDLSASLRGWQMDHIIAEFHGGTAELPNLAAACAFCNACKGTNLAGIDPDTGQVTTLYNPRAHVWTDHFEFHGPAIRGTTPIGRSTVATLRFNDPDQLELRNEFLLAGFLFPNSP